MTENKLPEWITLALALTLAKQARTEAKTDMNLAAASAADDRHRWLDARRRYADASAATSVASDRLAAAVQAAFPGSDGRHIPGYDL